MPNIPLWQKLLIGALGLLLLTLSGVGVKLFTDSKTSESKSAGVSSVPSVATSISPSPDRKDIRIHVWAGENRESMADVEVEFLVSNGSPHKSKTGTDGYTSIKIPNGVDVRVTLRKKGFKTDTYTINPSINSGETIEYELKPNPRQSFSPPPLPSPTSFLPTPSSPYPLSPSPLPTSSSKSISLPAKSPYSSPTVSQPSYQYSPPPLHTPSFTFIPPTPQVPSSTVKILKPSYKKDELALLDGYTIEIFF